MKKKSLSRQSFEATAPLSRAAAQVSANARFDARDCDRAWKIAQLAATLASKTYVNPQASDGGKFLEDHNRKVELGWAIEQASFLLAAAEYTARTEHAYELFNSGLYTIEQARKVFQRHNWPKLTSWHSVDELFAEILRRLQILAQPSSPDSAAANLKLDLPSAIPPEYALFWRDPKSLKVQRGEKTDYEARQILLLARAYLRDQFSDRIERQAP